MNTKILLCIVVMLMISISGCSDPESSARKLYNEGMTLMRSGQREASKAKFDEVVAKYPETQTAVEVNNILLTLGTIEMNEKALQIRQEDLLAGLDMFKLDVGRYPTEEEGILALIKKPSTVNHWQGPYMRRLLPMDMVFEYRVINGNPELEIIR